MTPTDAPSNRMFSWWRSPWIRPAASGRPASVAVVEPDERDRVFDHARVGRRDEIPDQRRRPFAVRDGRPRPVLVGRRRTGEARPLGGGRQRVDPWAHEPRRRGPARGVVLELGQRDADAAEMDRRQPTIDEPAVEPAQEHARARLRDAWLRRGDDERAVARHDGRRNAQRRVAGQRGEPGHLRADGRRAVEVRPADPQHVSRPAGIDAKRHVLLVTEQRQAPVLQVPGVGGQRRSTQASEPPELPATAQRVVRTHGPERSGRPLPGPGRYSRQVSPR